MFLDLSRNILIQLNLFPVLLKDQRQTNRTKRSILQSLLFDSSNEIQELKQKLHILRKIANNNIIRENLLLKKMSHALRQLKN